MTPALEVFVEALTRSAEECLVQRHEEKLTLKALDLKAAERDAARGWCIRDAVVSGRNVDKNAPTSPPPLLR